MSHARRIYFLCVLLLCMLILQFEGAVAKAAVHPEAFAGRVASRSDNEVILSIDRGTQFGRDEELWVYQKYDTVVEGGEIVKASWRRIGKIRVVASGPLMAKASVLEEAADSPIAVGDEAGRLPNTNPIIIEVALEPDRIAPNSEVILHIKAQDEEGDPLVYKAQANEGRFLDPSERSPVMQWVAPKQPGEYEITIYVSDGKGGSAQRRIPIFVDAISDRAPYGLAWILGGKKRDPWQLYEITDIAVDERDNIWVLDGRKKSLRTISPTGIETRMIDLSSIESLSNFSPSDICLGSQNSIYLLDKPNILVLLDSNGNLKQSVFEAKNRKDFHIYTPSDMCSNRDGDLVITDSTKGYVVVIDRDGMFLALFASQGGRKGQLKTPVSIATNKFGDYFVLDADKDETLEFDQSYHFRTSHKCSIEGDEGKLLIDGREGFLYVLDYENGSVKKLDQEGTLTTHISPFDVERRSTDPVASSIGIRLNGNILLSTTDANIREYDADGNLQKLLGEKELGKILGMAVTDEGNLFVLDGDGMQVRKYDRNKWLKNIFPDERRPGGTQERSAAVCVDGAGNIYVFNNRESAIQKYAVNGKLVRNIPIRHNVARSLRDAVDMHVAENGAIYILDGKEKKVLILSESGRLETEVRLPVPGVKTMKQPIRRPENITVDDAGYIYVSDSSKYVILKYNTDGEILERIGQKGTGPGKFGKIADIATDKRGMLYALLRDRSAVVKFDSYGRFVSHISLDVNTNTQLKDPQILAVDSLGTMYIWDKTHNAVFKFIQ